LLTFPAALFPFVCAWNESGVLVLFPFSADRVVVGITVCELNPWAATAINRTTMARILAFDKRPPLQLLEFVRQERLF
jgi:hypothetical protein